MVSIYSILASAALFSVALASVKVEFEGLPTDKSFDAVTNSFTFSYKSPSQPDAFPVANTVAYVSQGGFLSYFQKPKLTCKLESVAIDFTANGFQQARCNIGGKLDLSNKNQLYLENTDTKAKSNWSPKFYSSATTVTDKVANVANQAKEKAKKVTSSIEPPKTFLTTRGALKDGAEKTENAANQVTDKASETAKNVKDSVKGGVENSQNKAQETADNTADAAKDANEKAKEAGHDAKANIEETSQSNWQWFKSKVGSLFGRGKKQVKDTTAKAAETVESQAGKVKVEAEEVGSTAAAFADVSLFKSGLAVVVALVSIITLAA